MVDSTHAGLSPIHFQSPAPSLLPSATNIIRSPVDFPALIVFLPVPNPLSVHLLRKLFSPRSPCSVPEFGQVLRFRSILRYSQIFAVSSWRPSKQRPGRREDFLECGPHKARAIDSQVIRHG